MCLISLWYRLSGVIVLTAISLAIGSIFPAGPAQALPWSPSTDGRETAGVPAKSPRGATSPWSQPTDKKGSAGADDGFQQSARAFRTRVNRAHEIMADLQKIQSEATARHPGNRSEQQAYLARRLNEIYPGSTLAGDRGTVAFQKYLVATFNSSLVVDNITENGDVTATYLLEPGQILITYGANSVTIVIDRSNPANSRFIKADIPAMKAGAEKVLTVPGYMRKTTDSVETSVLNDAYQLLSQTEALRMEFFAADVMRYQASQKKALSIALNGYFERHPQEYQRSAEPVAASKVTDRTPSINVGTVAKNSGLILLMGVLAMGLFWGARLLLNRSKLLFMDHSEREYLKKYSSLTPRVLRALREAGDALWGKNFPWSRKYYLTKHDDGWTLSDGKLDLYNQNALPDTIIEVWLRDDNFKIQVSRIRGTAAEMVVRTNGYAPEELREHLRQIRNEIF